MLGSNGSIGVVDDERVKHATRILRAGGVVVYPTETLYGLGADAGNAAALQRLVELKGREPGKPIAVLIGNVRMLGAVVADIPPLAEALMRRFWPGPLTIVLPARASLSPVLTGGGDGIGVRLSRHPMATALVRCLGQPVTAPSANPAGQPPPRRIEEARIYFGSRVDFYLDAGCLAGEPASTVVDVRGELRVVRRGAIAAEQLWSAARDAR
jgi:L-threonylcarbamoyladenylate synthase